MDTSTDTNRPNRLDRLQRLHELHRVHIMSVQKLQKNPKVSYHPHLTYITIPCITNLHTNHTQPSHLMAYFSIPIHYIRIIRLHINSLWWLVEFLLSQAESGVAKIKAMKYSWSKVTSDTSAYHLMTVSPWDLKAPKITPGNDHCDPTLRFFQAGKPSTSKLCWLGRDSCDRSQESTTT